MHVAVFLKFWLWIKYRGCHLEVFILDTIDENIIGAPIMQNYFLVPYHNVNFFQYWTILYIAPDIVIALPTLRLQSWSLLISLLGWSMVLFCNAFHIVIASKIEISDNYRHRERAIKIRGKELIAKIKQKRRLKAITLQEALENSQILLSQYWKKEQFEITKIISHLGIPLIFSTTVLLF